MNNIHTHGQGLLFCSRRKQKWEKSVGFRGVEISEIYQMIFNSKITICCVAWTCVEALHEGLHVRCGCVLIATAEVGFGSVLSYAVIVVRGLFEIEMH